MQTSIPVPPDKAKVEVKAHGGIEIALQGIHPLPTNAYFTLPNSIPDLVNFVRTEIIIPLDAMIT
jgi:hypothetical protein